MPDTLTPEHRWRLLQLAHAAVESAVRHRPLPDWPRDARPLAAPGAAFVTLRERSTGDLRGCRGEVVAVRSLAESVIDGAVAAAIDDPRFPPVSERELADLTFEISRLTPMRRVRPEEVEVPRHGVMITCRGRRGLLLPQVAPEQGWGRDELLAGVCRKAGLPATAWRDAGARLEVFEAEVWGDGDGETA
jgi:AmmeMemoRadiSam system protein A